MALLDQLMAASKSAADAALAAVSKEHPLVAGLSAQQELSKAQQEMEDSQKLAHVQQLSTQQMALQQQLLQAAGIDVQQLGSIKTPQFKLGSTQ